MKKILLKWAVVLQLLAFVACKKNDLKPLAVLEASKTDHIQMGEPVSFSMNSVASGASVNWSVSPSTGVTIRNQGNAASVIFARSGNFNITATSGSNTQSNNVLVDTVVYNPHTITDFQALLPGELITLTPSVEGYTDSIALSINAITNNKYNCLNNYLIGKLTYAQNNYTISYDGVFSGTSCTPGQVKASSYLRIGWLFEGTSAFNVILNGKTYTGSVRKSGNTFTFTWPYNSGVIISPLTVSK